MNSLSRRKDTVHHPKPRAGPLEDLPAFYQSTLLADSQVVQFRQFKAF